MNQREIDFTHPSFDTSRRWRARAACADPDIAGDANWFPEQHQARAAATENAYRICREECPVRLQCLRFALITDRHRDRGIFGGLSPRQRSTLRARLVARGLLPMVRICANPLCRREFPAKQTTPRDNVRCPACRGGRQRAAVSGRGGL